MKTLKILTAYFLLVSIFIEATGCACKLIPTKCFDGRTVFHPKSLKCAERFYKDAVKEFSMTIKATVNVADQVKVDLANLETKNKVNLLKEKLNNESIRMEILVKTSFYHLVMDPCGESQANDELLKLLAEKNYEIEKLRIDMQVALDQNKGDKEVEKVIEEFGKQYKFLDKP